MLQHWLTFAIISAVAGFVSVWTGVHAKNLFNKSNQANSDKKMVEQKHHGSGDNVAGKKISVKDSPYSINTIDQQGNNQINIGVQQRNITQDIIGKLNSVLPKNKNQVIEVNSIDGDTEAFRFANQIKEHLESLGYTVTGVDKRIYATDWTDAHIFTNEDGGLKEIIVGRQP